MEKWGETWEEVNLERLYIFLHEQLAQSDDTWVTETLQWWNKFRCRLRFIPHVLMTF